MLCRNDGAIRPILLPGESIDDKTEYTARTKDLLPPLEITKRGKTIITTMALGEPNKFETSKQQKSYTEILASMDKRGKKGYRTPKYAASNSLNLREAFNSDYDYLNEKSAKMVTYKYIKENNSFPDVDKIVQLMKEDVRYSNDSSEESKKLAAQNAINYWSQYMSR